jgi:hypothetical protein
VRRALASLLFPITVATSLAAQPAPAAASRPSPAGSYGFRMVDDDGDVTTGNVLWSGTTVRIDMDRGARRRDRAARRNNSGPSFNVMSDDGDYLIIDNASGTLFSVKPARREIEEMPVATFEGIIGKALGAVKLMVQMQVQNAGILARELGAGEPVAAQATRHYRLIEEFDVNVGVFGMSAERKHHRVVTDYWVPTGAGLPRNPVAELVLRAPAALAQQDARHAGNVTRARAALFTAAPIKVVTTVREASETEKRSEFEVTNVSTAAPEAARLALPDGYRRSKASMPSFEM